MRIALMIIMVVSGLFASAQFPYHPLPFKGSDFRKIKEKGYTRLLVYQESSEGKVISNDIVYRKNGFIDTIYEIGVNENGDTSSVGYAHYIFDERGYLMSVTDESEEYGSSFTTYTYNHVKKLVRKQTATIDPPTSTYKYDAKGMLSEVNITQTMPEYEEDGEWKGKTIEKPSYRYVYRYDVKGRLHEEWEYYLPLESKTDPPSYRTRWIYNEKNQVMQLKRMEGDGTLISSQQFEYNKDGLLIKRTISEDGEDKVYYYHYCTNCAAPYGTGK